MIDPTIQPSCWPNLMLPKSKAGWLLIALPFASARPVDCSEYPKFSREQLIRSLILVIYKPLVQSNNSPSLRPLVLFFLHTAERHVRQGPFTLFPFVAPTTPLLHVPVLTRHQKVDRLFPPLNFLFFMPGSNAGFKEEGSFMWDV